MKKIVIVKVDGWQGLYVDGKVIHQDHNLTLRDFFALLKAHGVSTCIDFNEVWAGARDETMALDNGYLPDTLAELKDTKL